MSDRRHPRAKLTAEVRRLLVWRVRELGWAPARAAEAQGCSRATVYKWLARYDGEGDAGLGERSSRPRRTPARLSPARERAILERRAATREGPHRLAWTVEGASPNAHPVAAQHRVARLRDLDKPTGAPVRYQRDRPGELVHIDIKKQGRIPDGGGHRVTGRPQGQRNRARSRCRAGYDFLHCAVDDRSRVAYVEAHANERGATAAAFLQRAVAWFAEHGVAVERVLTHNGAAYRSRMFRDALAETNVAHQRTRPYRPQTNSKVERFNLTLNREWAYAAVYTANSDRLDQLPRFVHHYNCHRPHSAHQGKPPMSTVNNPSGNRT